MSETPTETPVQDLPFVRDVVVQIRAQDTFGTWDKKADADLLEAWILDKEKRQQVPIVGDPDPDTLARVEMFYSAVGLRIEQRTGLMASPLMQMHHEGFGRMVLTCGRLVVVNKNLRDVHRFGFPSLEKMNEAGEKLVSDAVAMIERFPEVARYG